jgi:hypothetical protein
MLVPLKYLPSLELVPMPVFSSRTDVALLMVQLEEAQWVMKADGYLWLEAQAGVTDCAVWDLVQEETGV